MSVEIRETRSEDIKAVKKIEVETGLSSWSEESYISELKRADSLFFVAAYKKDAFYQGFPDKEVVGFVIARLIKTDNYHLHSLSNALNQTEIEIYNIAVIKRFRNHKIGTRLLGKILESASEIGAGKIYLEVRRSNLAAIEFYQRNGFTEIGERRNFYTNPTEDALLMCRTKETCNLKVC